jgi:hypothetical protein
MKKEIITAQDQSVIESLKNSFPVEKGFNKIILPRIGMYSQDVVEGKGKNMTVVAEAGTFYTEVQTDELDEEGRKVWKKTEIGSTFKGVILYKRKQLRMYDEQTELYTSSPVYDNDDEVLPLFCNKNEVTRGTPEQLKAKYNYQTKDGKTRSKLEDNRILYVLYNDEVYQLNLRGTSMYAYKTYERKVSTPSLVLTVFGSESKEKGTIAWNQMTFEVFSHLTSPELSNVQKKVSEIKEAVVLEKQFYSPAKQDDELEKLMGN